MSKHLMLQKAVVLHTRPYRNTSLLVDFFSEQAGVLRCVAKGYKKQTSVHLSPFAVFDVSFAGRGELKTLTQCELFQAPFNLKKQALYCGLYINELLLRVLYPHDPHAGLFDITCMLYAKLQETVNLIEMEFFLRIYEFSLLKEIGYLVETNFDCTTGEVILPGLRYKFDSESGFSLAKDTDNQMTFSGETILILSAFDESHFHNEQVRREAKILSRLMLAPYIGMKPLKSRALFQKLDTQEI